ncbi:MAG: hypothetical protein M0042_03680 [Nitrospiraceae bacterium]|nr:hypothetical protein [Nitrospiraceae bacterium]
MKKTILTLSLLLLLIPQAQACVGKVLTIGVKASSDRQLLAEMLSSIIMERTGTTVQIRLFKTDLELHEAIKSKQVDLSIENTITALKELHHAPETDLNKALEVVRTAYEKDRGLVWLKPFAFLNGSGQTPSYTATVVREDIFTNFPALPRVIAKLGAAVTDEAYMRLVRSVEAGEQPKKVAKEFLKSKKLI